MIFINNDKIQYFFFYFFYFCYFFNYRNYELESKKSLDSIVKLNVKEAAKIR